MCEVALGQRCLDRRLALQQPIQRAVKFVLIDRTETEQFAEARCGGGRRQRAGGGELGCGIENAADQKAEHKVTATSTAGAEDTVEADLERGAERRGDVTVRQAADHGEGVTLSRNDRAASQCAAQALDVGDRPVREIAERALTNFTALAVALAQEDGRRRVPVRNGFDVHGQVCAYTKASYKYQI